MNQIANTEFNVNKEAAKPLDLSSSNDQLFVARQPIFDRNTNVTAYELLFRSSKTNASSFACGNEASCQVMFNAFVEIGLESIAGNKPVFVNLTRDFLIGELPIPLPAAQIVLEILEDIKIDDELLRVLRKLSEQGYTLALDDYTFTEEKAEIFEIIDIVKIDLPACDSATLEANVAALKKLNVKLLAEKVETYEEYELCKSLGFDYFQGYYFSKPKIISRQTIKPNRMSVLRILSMVQDPRCEISKLEELISNDVAISHKLLRIVNSALYNLPVRVESVKQAIVSLGLKTIREWMLVIILTDIDDKPKEIIALCLQRAHMMRKLAGSKGKQADAAFTIGLFSLIDALMDEPMSKILGELPLVEEVSKALLAREGLLGELMTTVTHYEKGSWSEISTDKFSAETLRENYLESINWTADLMADMSKAA